MHVEEPASEYLPTPHTMQFAAAVAPMPEKLVPAAQFVHDAAFTSLHVPDGQVMQLVNVAWPMRELYFPAMQLVHVALPI